MKTCTQDIAKNKFVWHYENTKENYKKKKEKSNVRNENQKPQIKVIKQSENSNEQKSHSPSKNYVKSPSKSF